MPYFYMLTAAHMQKTDDAYVLEERSYVRAKESRPQLGVLRGALVDSWGAKRCEFTTEYSHLHIWMYIGAINIRIF